MPRAKSPRGGNGTAKNVTPINQGIVSEVKKNSSPTNLESEIRRRAYELYEQRGCTPGHEYEDWLLAEREILARHNQQTA
jgi:hypothetical protein